VKEHPNFRSISCRASTDLASSSFGEPKVSIAFFKSTGAREENFARQTCCTPGNFFKFGTTFSMTSKQIFSPSRSQSSHKTR